MAQVTLPVQIDSSPLNVGDLNAAFYSKTPGEGLYSEPNGGVELQSSRNGDASFLIKQEHIQPEQIIKSRFDGMWHTRDNMSDVSGYTTVDDNDVEVAKYQSLPGCALRVYVPFTATALRWNLSFFWYAAKWLGMYQQQESYLTQATRIRTFVFVDGLNVPHLERDYPMTWFKRSWESYASSSGGNNENPWSTEAEQASAMNLSYLQTDVDIGFHEVYLGFYVKPLLDNDGNVVNFWRDKITTTQRSTSLLGSKNTLMFQRLSIGVSSARVVAFR